MPPLPPHSIDPAKVEAGIRLVLEGLGQSDKPEVMENTPRRVTDLWVEAMNPAWVDVEDPFKTFASPNMGAHDLVIVNDVHYVSWCEHHLAPALGVAHVAYVPGERVVGYSKLKKGLNYVARQPQLNERILTTLLDIISEQIQPVGVAVVLQSVHLCIALRSSGPAQEVVTVQGFRGVLRDEPHHGDFMRTVAMRKPLFLGP